MVIFAPPTLPLAVAGGLGLALLSPCAQAEKATNSATNDESMKSLRFILHEFGVVKDIDNRSKIDKQLPAGYFL